MKEECENGQYNEVCATCNTPHTHPNQNPQGTDLSYWDLQSMKKRIQSSIENGRGILLTSEVRNFVKLESSGNNEEWKLVKNLHTGTQMSSNQSLNPLNNLCKKSEKKNSELLKLEIKLPMAIATTYVAASSQTK